MKLIRYDIRKKNREKKTRQIILVKKLQNNQFRKLSKYYTKKVMKKKNRNKKRTNYNINQKKEVKSIKKIKLQINNTKNYAVMIVTK